MNYLKIGSYLVQKGLLNKSQVETIMKAQKPGYGIKNRFGRIAVQKGFISEDILRRNIIHKYKEEMLEGRYEGLSVM